MIFLIVTNFFVSWQKNSFTSGFRLLYSSVLHRLQKKDCMNLYFQRKQSYHISPYLSWKELCFHSGCSQIKAKLNIISHLCFHITIIPSKQNYISKFCTTRSSHSRRLRDKISCWSSVQPKKEHEFAKFQVDHSSSGQSIEWRALISSAMFCNILSSRYARHRETFPPFWGQFPVVDDM